MTRTAIIQRSESGLPRREDGQAPSLRFSTLAQGGLDLQRLSFSEGWFHGDQINARRDSGSGPGNSERLALCRLPFAQFSTWFSVSENLLRVGINRDDSKCEQVFARRRQFAIEVDFLIRIVFEDYQDGNAGQCLTRRLSVAG